jgi:hypothetical protein
VHRSRRAQASRHAGCTLRFVVTSARRFLLVLTAAAVLAAVLQGLTGVTDLALYSAPLLLIVCLLLGGRFVGEERIVARWRAARPRRRASLRRHWPRTRERALASLLERSPRQLRGPPAASAA